MQPYLVSRPLYLTASSKTATGLEVLVGVSLRLQFLYDCLIQHLARV